MKNNIKTFIVCILIGIVVNTSTIIKPLEVQAEQIKQTDDFTTEQGVEIMILREEKRTLAGLLEQQTLEIHKLQKILIDKGYTKLILCIDQD